MGLRERAPHTVIVVSGAAMTEIADIVSLGFKKFFFLHFMSIWTWILTTSSVYHKENLQTILFVGQIIRHGKLWQNREFDNYNLISFSMDIQRFRI